ncbi:MAG TPA: class I SAM-dependent methyltransferase [Solirubrobacteraceae bacterium]|nr:class I SAM-dependent methyltransferase [Solirubrobacteraceae bacterium]
MSSSYALAQFRRDPATGLRLAPHEGTPAGYLDGGEARLAEIFTTARDLGVTSAELRSHIDDWVTDYHLSAYRATLFDAIGLHAGDARVLELGAGCGAITRWLGEHCGEVHAIEGDAARARVARLRCRDQDNVEVYVGNYSELDEHDAFDLVTLIGVLEYGHHYHPETDDPRRAAELNLAVARRALRDDGLLVLAIENRLGLKYLGGAREDHSGRPYDSVHGYPGGGPAQTFNARELRSLVTAAGFGEHALLLPFPDYKLARTIVNADAMRPADRIHNWVDTPAPDRGAERGPIPFDETLATREVAAAGLLADLSNSFLVVAFAGDPARAAERHGLDLDWVARHWSLDRRAAFTKRATLRRGDAGAPDVVEHEPAAPAQDPDAPEERRRVAAVCGISQRLGPEPFRHGDLLVLRAHEALVAEGVGARLAALVREHAGWLEGHYGTGHADEAGVALLAGTAFDATWWNIVVDPVSGAWSPIDEEWDLGGPLPLDAVLRRTLEHFALRHRAQLPAPWATLPATQFAAHVLAEAGMPLGSERREVLELLEREIAHALGPFPAGDLQVDRVNVLALAEEAIARPGLLAAYRDRFDAADPVTLVLYEPAPGSPDVTERLVAALEAVGLAREGGPDLVLVAPPEPVDGADATVASGVAAVLSTTGYASSAFADLPHFGEDAMDDLAALVTRWTAAPLAA